MHIPSLMFVFLHRLCDPGMGSSHYSSLKIKRPLTMRRSVDARDVKMQTVTSNGYSPRDMHIGNVRVM